MLGSWLTVFALLVGCTPGPSNRPAVLVGGAEQNSPAPESPGAKPLPPLEESDAAAIDWRDCADQTRARLQQNGSTVGIASNVKLDCGRLSARSDTPGLSTPSTARIELLRAGNGKVPLVVLNDVDGLPGTLYAAQLAAQLPPAVLQKFTLIGLDRRGTGRSGGLDCIDDSARARIIGFDPTSTELDPLLTAEREAAQNCQGELELQLSSLDSYHTAEDLDQLRDLLGVQHLNAIGRGEGSRVLGMYAQRFREHVGRFTLDGYPDPSAEIVDRTKTKAHSAEATFDAFADSCTASKCPLGNDPRKTVTALITKLRTTPVKDITAGLAVRALLAGLADRGSWPALASALAALKNGNDKPTRAILSAAYTAQRNDGARLDSSLVIGCNDEPARTPPQQVATLVQSWRTELPLFGGTLAQGLLWCGPWPVSAHPVSAPSTQDLPPLVMVSTQNDPVTPEEGTQRAAQQWGSASLISWSGSGHGALGASDCVNSRVEKFLVDGEIPSADTVCPA